MRCARCGRMLLRPGVEVPVAGGGKLIAGPRCAELLVYGELGRPRRGRVIVPVRRPRATPQLPLFGTVA